MVNGTDIKQRTMKRLILSLLLLASLSGRAQLCPTTLTEFNSAVDSIVALKPFRLAYHDSLWDAWTCFYNTYGAGTAIVPGDTAAMLQSYLQRGDTATMLQYFIERSDTASMLTPYISRGDTAAAFVPFIERSDTAAMLNFYRKKSGIVLATDYTGISNDGTQITQENFEAFITATSGRQVYWPAGTYTFAGSACDINVLANINWIGEGDATVLVNFEEFSPYGDYLRIRNMKIRGSNYVIRWDALEATTADTIELVEISGVSFQHVQGAIRLPETSLIWPRVVKINEVRYDTIGSEGAAFNISGGAGLFQVENVWINYTEDSTWAGGMILSSEQPVSGVDTAIYINNLIFTNLWSDEGYGTANNIYTLYCEAQDGTVIKASNVKTSNTNIPLFYLRGASTVIYDHFDVRCTSLRSDFTGPVILSKTRRNNQEPAMVLRNSIIKVPDITAVYKENRGDVWLIDNYLENSGTGSNYTFNVSVGEDPNYPMTIYLEGNTIKNTNASAGGVLGVPAEVSNLYCYNNRFFVTNVASGIDGLFFAGADLGYTMELAKFTDNYFYGVRPAIGFRYLRNLVFKDNHFVGSGVYGFSAQNSAVVDGNIFSSFSTDSVTASSSSYDFSIVSQASYLNISNNFYDLINIYRSGNVSLGNYGTDPDTIIFNNNHGTINGQINSGQRMLRLATADYLEVMGNNITFGGLAGSNRPSLFYAVTSITNALIANNTLKMANGNNVDKMIDGTATITSLRAFNNTGFTTFNSGNTITYANMAASGLEDMSGNEYLTEATAYTQTEVDSALISPTTEIKSASYELTSADAGKIIFISGTSTITIPTGLTWEVGQSIQIIRVDGGTISTETTAVTVEYPDNTSAEDDSITQAAVFIKRADNSYIRIGD